MIVLILFAPAVWNLCQHHTSFLHCDHYNTIQSILFEDVNSLDKNLFKLSDNELTLILLYVSTKYSLMNNGILLNSSIKYIENSKHFLVVPLFQCNVINSFNVTEVFLMLLFFFLFNYSSHQSSGLTLERLYLVLISISTRLLILLSYISL